jgi:hypothetical protein
MVRLTEELKTILKKPLGKTGPLGRLLPSTRGKKIIAVGDQVVFALLSKGIRPHVAVFDFKTLRNPVDIKVRARLEKEYPDANRVSNPAGEITEGLVLIAPILLRDGGALLVEGEEDLAALVFIEIMEKGYVVLYGQPGEGAVLVEDNSEGKKIAKKIAGKLGLASLSD